MSNPSLEIALLAELETIRSAGLYRELRPVAGAQGPSVTQRGVTLRNFSSNDYLGLAGHPALREAATRAVADFGSGAGASRLVCGSLAIFHHLEERLAAFKDTPAALSFANGYTTALGTIPALAGKEDILILDKQVHACFIDAARLSGATVRVFRHNDPEDLQAKLQATDRIRVAASASPQRKPRTFVITESVFSMDGDLAPLREIVELKDRYGAWLLLDEAHATGLFGEHRRGLAEAYELSSHVDIHLGTLGKAFGAAGGYICGSRALIDLLINRARSFIFSTAPVPAAAAAANAAVEVVQSAEGERLRQRLWQQVDATKNTVIEAGWPLPPVQSPILPLIIGSEEAALRQAAALREHGLLIPAIRYPSVARGKARLRLTVSAAHSAADLTALGTALSTTRSLA